MVATMTKNQEFFKVLDERHSVKKYDPTHKMSKEEINELLAYTQKAPSAWNLQQWKFLVVEEQEAKERLLPIAYGQKQIVESSAVIMILGDLEGNKNADTIYNEAVSAGYMTEDIKNNIVGQINSAYENNQVARDQAILNASLAAMQLMLAARALGYDTCPMGGFDAKKCTEEFNITNRYVPIMLISVGKALEPAYPSSRFPVENVTMWNNFTH